MTVVRPDNSFEDPPQVLIVGGGVAALETMLALHDLAAGRLRVTLVAPNRSFVDPSLAVAVPFGLAEPRSWDLPALAREHGAIYVRDAAVSVDAARRVVVTKSGAELPYDALVLATGARRLPALAGAITFGGHGQATALADLLVELESGAVRSVAFAIPAAGWTLPAYELALMTAAHLAAHGVRDAELSLATVERAPLGVFGRRATQTVTKLLKEAGVALHVDPPVVSAPDRLVLASGRSIKADRVVALPRLAAPDLPGVPVSRTGFVPVDEHGRVDFLDDVYAAGDATWQPVKQGGIAAQQADAVAEAIAAWAGAPIEPKPFRPVLRGALLTGHGVQYMRHRPRGGDTAPAPQPLWWPPAKIAGRYLAAYLAGQTGEEGPGPVLGDVPRWTADDGSGALTLAFEAADADARWGDYSSALRWLAVAEELAIALPVEYAEKRERWRDALAGLPAGA
jgi:sulfide:quinone oxidoreductase